MSFVKWLYVNGVVEGSSFAMTKKKLSYANWWIETENKKKNEQKIGKNYQFALSEFEANKI